MLAWINFLLQSLARGLVLHGAPAWYKSYNSPSPSELSIRLKVREDSETVNGSNFLEQKKKKKIVLNLIPASGNNENSPNLK